MKKLLIFILLVLQAGYIYSQDNNNHVGSYNPEEDMTRYNDSFGPDKLLWWTDKLFVKKTPEGDTITYEGSRFDKYYGLIGRIIFLIVLHLLYTRLGFRKPNYTKDVKKALYRYKFVLVVFGVICVLSTFSDSFILGVLMAVFTLWLIATLMLIAKKNLCPECCTYNHVKTYEVPLDEYSNEIHGLKTRTSQFLKADQIKPESWPKEEYKIYLVQKYRCNNHCTKCNAEWDDEVWKRIKELV